MVITSEYTTVIRFTAREATALRDDLAKMDLSGSKQTHIVLDALNEILDSGE